MPVSVRLPTILRSHAGGLSQVSAEGATVGELIDDLLRQFPGMAANLRTPEGGLHRFVNFYVNDEDIRYIDKLDTKLAPGDEVSIVPAVAGGSA